MSSDSHDFIRTAMSQHFPPAIRERLAQAAATPVGPGDPLARVRAIDSATEWARTRFPELFRWTEEQSA